MHRKTEDGRKNVLSTDLPCTLCFDLVGGLSASWDPETERECLQARVKALQEQLVNTRQRLDELFSTQDR